jgi:hypothetical protein
MVNRCKICGKAMSKCQDEIGPTCLRRIKNRRIYRRHRMLGQPSVDLFEENGNGQGAHERTDSCAEK